MLKIEIKSTKIEIPQTWDDLSCELYLFVVENLIRHLNGEINCDELRLRVLCKAVNYKEVKHNKLKREILYLITIGKYYFKRKFNRITTENYISIVKAASEKYLNKERGLVDYNLIKLSECLEFLMSEKIEPSFSKNPIPIIKKCGKGRSFDISIVPRTNLTAGNFADAMDLIAAYENVRDEKILDWLIAITYGSKKYNGISDIDSSKFSVIEKLDISVKYGVYLWYISLSRYFAQHPIYSLLYNKSEESITEKIQLGINESIIRISAAGYGSHNEIRDKNLIAFMDIQIADMKKSIKDAVASGIDISKIAEKTGYTITQIDMML